MLRRLAWSSEPSPAFFDVHLDENVAAWRRNNERRHVSGMLLFTGAHFLAILEGHEWDLDRLWLRLEEDERHRELVRIGDERCGQRWFPHWLMGRTQHAAVSAQIERLRSPRTMPASRWAETIRPILMLADAV